MTALLDRHDTPLQVGQYVVVQHCTGPYGSTEQVRGRIASLDLRYRGVTLTLAQETRRLERMPGGVDAVRYLKPGENAYFPLPTGEQVGDAIRCYRRFDDFEHGHETWIEVQPTKTATEENT